MTVHYWVGADLGLRDARLTDLGGSVVTFGDKLGPAGKLAPMPRVLSVVADDRALLAWVLQGPEDAKYRVRVERVGT